MRIQGQLYYDVFIMGGNFHDSGLGHGCKDSFSPRGRDPWEVAKRHARAGRPASLATLALVLAGLLGGAVTSALGQLALVETTTLTAAREAVRVYANTVNLDPEVPFTPSVALPGEVFSAVPPISSNGKLAVFTTRSGRGNTGFPLETVVSVVGTAPVALNAQGWVLSEPGWRHVATCLTSLPGSDLALVLLEEPWHRTTVGAGRIEVRTIDDGPVPVLALKGASWLLPGAPVAALALRYRPLVAVLCSDERFGALLHVRDVARGKVVVEAQPLSDSFPRLRPITLAQNVDARYIVALSTGPGTDPATAQDSTWVYVLGANNYNAIGEPLEITGIPLDDVAPIHPATDGSFWIATRTPGSGFAYLTHVEVEDRGPRTIAARSFSGVSQPLRVAPATDGSTVAIGIERRVELWQGGKPIGKPLPFEDPIGALAWDKGRILVGEGNRLHVLDSESRTEVKLAAFQSGVVTGIAPLQTSGKPDPRAFQDTDGDGTVDALDPEPAQPSPRLHPPYVIQFRGESAGRAFRAVQLVSDGNASATWQLHFDSEQVPWLSAYPQSGTIPGWFLMGVDADRYTQGATGAGSVTVTVTGTDRNTPAVGSPYRIAVRVMPTRPKIRRILWALGAEAGEEPLRSDADPRGLKAAADLLAQPPNYFSHQESTGPFLNSLDAFSVVVLTPQAIASGIITRQSVLDFVSAGGALLVLAQHDDTEGLPSISRWLSPVGITLDTAESVSGTFKATRDEPLVRHCGDLTLANGARVLVDDTVDLVIPVDGAQREAAFATRSYGAGRIAVLAASTPLESRALQRQSNRQFAADLFRWLSTAGPENNDLDGDGLPDHLEDKDGDGVVGPGETDKLNPDTDGDGIPDGAEDRNRNGLVDEGETSPLNPDSDGDGIHDGADLTPLPSVNAPRVTRVEPQSGPAEGGTGVLIEGRSFAPDAQVWFGDSPAANVRQLGPGSLRVDTPPSPSGNEGAVDVRVANPDLTPASVVPDGFVYGPRSWVHLTLTSIADANRQYEGTVSIDLEKNTTVRVGRIVLRMDTAPAGELLWSDLRPGADGEIGGRRVLQSPSTEWGIRFEVTAPVRPPLDGEVATVRWSSKRPRFFKGNVPVLLPEARAYAVNGEPINVETGSTVAQWVSPGDVGVLLPSGN